MKITSRRNFIRASAGAAAICAADLNFLATLSHAAASDTTIKPDDVTFGADTDRLLRLLRTTSREECIPAFVREIKAGLSYQQFLTVLFLAAIENGDPHQVAQVYGAHRVSSEARIEERLLPLFWVLYRIKQESEAGAKPNPAMGPFKGELPRSDRASGIFREALLKSDGAEAERAALALARDRGAQYVMRLLWEFSAQNVGGTLGHTAIAHANATRTLEAMGWQHAEVALRYVTGYVGGQKGDKTYASNMERVKQTLPGLPAGWANSASDRAATLELYNLLRQGKANESCDLICSQLGSGKVKAGSVWDAISLAAADSVFRHKEGGSMMGGQIHAVTTTNALRYGFSVADDTNMRLINLLQAAGVTADFFVRHYSKEGALRDINLLDLGNADAKTSGTISEVFELLPFKGREHPPKAEERASSDQACRMAFSLLRNQESHATFERAARSFLCVKASIDPHDIKFPVAAFEDTHSASPEWRPWLLASSVHCLHGTRSHDTPALVQVRKAFG